MKIILWNLAHFLRKYLCKVLNINRLHRAAGRAAVSR